MISLKLLALLLGSLTLADGAALTITHLTVQQSDDGAPLYPPDAFTAGETVHFSFYVEGFTRKENRVHLTFEAQPADPEGIALTPLISGKAETTLTPEDKDWLPKLRGDFVLPTVLLAGQYRIAIRLTDEMAAISSTKEISFRVTGPPKPAAATLSILHLAFYANDESEKPLETAAFRKGEEIHARFLVIGFRHGDAGAIDVSYGIRLADSAGRVLFEDAAAARDNSSQFYPKPFVPGILSLSLKPETAPGEYSLTVTARDAVGDQHAEARGSFRLE